MGDPCFDKKVGSFAPLLKSLVKITLDQENTTGISWNKHDLRVAVLEVLRSGSATNHRVGLSQRVIMDCLGIESNLQFETELDYLHKMKFVKMEGDSYYVTEAGLDYLDNNVTKSK